MASNATGMYYTTSSEGGITPALVIAAGSVLPILGIVAVALRFYSRLRSKNVGLGVDDWLILAAIVFTTGLGIMMILGASLHALASPTELPPGKASFLTFASPDLITTAKIFYAFNMVQCLAFGSAKLSVLFFYRRIFRGRLFDIVSITMIVIVCIWVVGFFFAMVFRCRTHFHTNWGPVANILADCYSSTAMFQAFSISDVGTDLLVISIPIYWVNTLHLPLAKRVAICGVFLLGFIAIAAGVARLVFFIKQSSSYEQNEDGIGHLTTKMYWSMIEIGISVIAACLPTIRLLFGGVTAESVIRSIRSSLSLPSQVSGNFSRNLKMRRRTPADRGTSRDKYEDIEVTERAGKVSGRLRTESS